MKTILLSLSLLLSLSSVPAYAQSFYAAENTPGISTSSGTPQAEIFARIQQHMRVPEVMKNTVSSERVRVVFTIDENGKAHVLDVNTRRSELKGSVTSQFEAIDFSDTNDTKGQEYSIWLNFKVM